MVAKHASGIRKRESHRPVHKIMTAGLSAIIAAGLLSSTAVAFGATANPDGSITVESGDTLSAIAQQFGGDWHDYTGYRSGDPNLIFPGEHVRDSKKATTECKVTIDWAAEAQRTYNGDYGVDPVRHDTLAGRYGVEAADKVQDLVNLMVAGSWAPGQPLPAGYESNECLVSQTTDGDDSGANTANPSSTQPDTATQQHHATKVWIVDRNGHFEPVFRDVLVHHQAVTQTRDHAAVTRTERVKVRDAWDEKVEHPAEYRTVHHPAQTHVEHVLVWPEHTVHHEAEYEDKVVVDKPAWDEKVETKPAWTETVHHPAEYQDRVVVEKEAWDEQVVDVPEHTEVRHHEAEYRTVHHEAVTHEVNHPAQTHVERKLKPGTGITKTVHHEAVTRQETVQTGTKKVLVKDAWTETVHHDAVTHEVNHPAITHVEKVMVTPEQRVPCWYVSDGTKFYSGAEADAYMDKKLDQGIALNVSQGYETVPAQYEDRTVVDKPAWTETVIDKPAWDETVQHPAEYKDEPVYETRTVVVTPAWDEKVDVPAEYEEVTVTDKEAWTETVVDKPAWDEQALVKEAWDETVTIPATYKTVHHDAVTHKESVLVKPACDEQVEHPAEYKTVHHDAVTHVERVKVKDAWDETIPAKYEKKTVTDREAWDENVLVRDAWVQTVHHAAEYVDRTIVVKPAWRETVVVRPAWSETVRRESGRRWVEPTGHWEWR